jgi:hypothetical protein
MGPQIDFEELRAAWRALQYETAGAGWRTIPILGGLACPILAGREFQGWLRLLGQNCFRDKWICLSG